MSLSAKATGAPSASAVRVMPTTYAYFAAFIAIGLVAASLGPTLPRLAENTGVELGQISFLFTSRSLGYLIGSYLGGRFYDRLPGHPIMAATVLLMAVTMARRQLCRCSGCWRWSSS
ncbi:MAG: MFS transporter [Caldilineaceae bacterium]|nr:MFS transporter [Caldilineaceae bacterium]